MNRKIHLTEQLLGLLALFLLFTVFAGYLHFLFALSLFLYIYICHWIGISAENKNREYTSFFWLSLLISPLLMGLIVAIMPKPKGNK